MTRRLSYFRDWIKYDRRIPKTRGHYPDGAIAALSFAFCLAAEQSEPGIFESEEVLRAKLNATWNEERAGDLRTSLAGRLTDKLLERFLGRRPANPERGRWVAFLLLTGDLVKQRDGSVVLPNWRRFQERTSADRMADKRLEGAGLLSLDEWAAAASRDGERDSGSDDERDGSRDTQRDDSRDSSSAPEVTGSVTKPPRAGARVGARGGRAPVETREPSLRSGRQETLLREGEAPAGATDPPGDELLELARAGNGGARPSPGYVSQLNRWSVRFGEPELIAAIRTAMGKGGADPVGDAVDVLVLAERQRGKNNGHAKPSRSTSTEDYDSTMRRDADEPDELGFGTAAGHIQGSTR